MNDLSSVIIVASEELLWAFASLHYRQQKGVKATKTHNQVDGYISGPNIEMHYSFKPSSK